jgi:hypothetical protein
MLTPYHPGALKPDDPLESIFDVQVRAEAGAAVATSIRTLPTASRETLSASDD